MLGLILCAKTSSVKVPRSLSRDISTSDTCRGDGFGELSSLRLHSITALRSQALEVLCQIL